MEKVWSKGSEEQQISQVTISFLLTNLLYSLICSIQHVINYFTIIE
jgi:hypothetical protein